MDEVVLRRLSDLVVLPPPLISPQERGLLDHVLATSIMKLDPPSRARLAERLSMQAEGPRELISTLALDDVAIAAPLLKESRVLGDGDLVRIIQTGSEDHRAFVAGRKKLTETITDSLIEYGEVRTLCILLGNEEAALSPWGMEVLARRSISVPEFLPLLLLRPELGFRLAYLVFWWASSVARLEILQRFTIERQRIHLGLDDLLWGTEVDNARSTSSGTITALLYPPFQADKEKLASFLSASYVDRMDELVAGLSLLVRVREETMFHILSDAGGEALAVLAKARGIGRKEFGDLIVASISARGGGLPTKDDLERMAGIYDSISTDRADFALRCWDQFIASETRLPADGVGAG